MLFYSGARLLPGLLGTSRHGYRCTVVPSSLDVLEHFFEYTPRRLFDATVDDIVELRALVASYFNCWSPPDLSDGETRLHLNLRSFRGFIPGHVPSVAVSYERSDLERFYDESDASTVRRLRRICSGPLLYADRVVDLDPLSFWVHNRETVPDREMSIWLIADAWEAMRRVAPLLDCGALVLAPIPDDAEMARLDEQLAKLADPATEYLAMYDGLALLTAQRTYATVPTVPWSAVEHLAAAVLGGRRAIARDQRVVDALLVIDLPILTDFPVATFAAIRESEPAFAAWRAELRMMSRLLPEAGDPHVFRQEAQLLFDDVFLPRVEEIRRTISRSQALRDAAREQPVRTTLGAIAAGGVAAATGGSIGVALASAGPDRRRPPAHTEGGPAR